MSDIAKNLELIEFDDYAKREMTRLSRMGTHESLYITPSGKLIDCRFPEYLGHAKVGAMIYDNIWELNKRESDGRVFKSCIIEYMDKDEKVDVEDVKAILLENAGIPNEVDQFSIDMKRKDLNIEDLPVHDLGFVKMVINSDGDVSLAIPNNMYNYRNVKAAQEETIENLLEFHKVKNFYLPTHLQMAKMMQSRERNNVRDLYHSM